MVWRRPVFSIVIPTYSRPRQLSDCLEALVHLDYPQDLYEVVIVDDGSPRLPEDEVARYRHTLDLKLIAQDHAGPAVARNTGAEAAEGDTLAFTDDDCRPDPHWLRALAARMREVPGAAVGGRTVNALPNNPCSSASQLLVSYLCAYYGSRDERGAFFASNNLAVPAESFHTSGGFDSRFPLAAGEDRDFCDRWVQGGHALVYAPEAIIYHEHALNLLSFLRQHFRYGRGALRFHQARAERGAERMGLEPLSFYVGMLRSPCSESRGPGTTLLLLSLLLLSQAANAGGFAWEMARASGTRRDERRGASAAGD